jgi:hypothetical protein
MFFLKVSQKNEGVRVTGAGISSSIIAFEFIRVYLRLSADAKPFPPVSR